MDECKSMHIPVKGPDVNESFSKFGVDSHGNIRFGLSAIKGVGENIVGEIIRVRKEGGPFESIYDFVERVPMSFMNRRILESLALAGAFDCFTGIKREDFFEKDHRDESLSEQLMRYGQLFQNATQRQEASLFGDEDITFNTAGRPPIKPAVGWVDAVRLEKERELVGMYLSAHPLDPYYMELTYGCSASIKSKNEIVPADNEGREITFGGMVVEFISRPARNGGNFGIMKIEDYTGSTEIRLFGQNYIDFANYGKPGTPIIVTGKFARRFRTSDIEFSLTGIRLLEDVRGHLVKGVTISLSKNQANEQLRALIDEQIKSSTNDRGQLNFRIYDPDINRSVLLSSGLKIPVNRRLVNMLDDMELEYSIERN